MFENVNIQVKLAENAGKTVARARVTFGDAFVINGISLVNGKNGLFVSYPNWKDDKGEYHDYFYPLTDGARKYITEAIIKMYENLKVSRY